MNDITLKIKNYKLIKDFDQELDNCRILLVTGKNDVGKSSLIRGILENLTAKSVTDNPLSIGETEGSKTFMVPDKNGNPVTIHHEFSKDNLKGSFYAIDYMGRKIKDVIRIRELIGICEELSIDEFYTLQKTAEGRKKIIKNYLYPLIDEGEMKQIIKIDTDTSKGGSLYDERTQVNAEINFLRPHIQKNTLTNEEKVLVEEYDAIKSNLEGTRAKRIMVSERMAKRDNLMHRTKEAEDKLAGFAVEYVELKEDFTRDKDRLLEEIEHLKHQIKLKENAINNAQQHYDTKFDKIANDERQAKETLQNLLKIEFPEIDDTDTLNDTIREGELFLDLASKARDKQQLFERDTKVIQEKVNHAASLEKQISDLRKMKATIIAKSSLPKGLVIDGDDFTYDGFAFTDAQISKSAALLVIAEILCKINTSKIVYLGEKMLFDKERFKQLIKIAEKNGKIPVLEEVIDEQTEVKIITEIYDA